MKSFYVYAMHKQTQVRSWEVKMDSEGVKVHGVGMSQPYPLNINFLTRLELIRLLNQNKIKECENKVKPLIETMIFPLVDQECEQRQQLSEMVVHTDPEIESSTLRFP